MDLLVNNLFLKKMGVLRIIAILAISILAACRIELQQPLADRIAQAAHHQSEVNLNQIVASEWSRMFILGPYTSEDLVINEVGESWPGFRSSGIERRDDICVLVFVKDSKIVDSVVMERKRIDFSVAVRKGGYARAESRFAIAGGKALPSSQLPK